MTNPTIKIDFDDKRGRFIIAAAPWLVQECRGLPNRRWDSGKRVWTAPAIRANAEYIMSKLMKDNRGVPSDVTPDARHQLEVACDTKAMVARRAFPTSTYKFKTKPRDHQMKCLHSLYGLRAMAMYMDMGTGKTKCAIDILCSLHAEKLVEAVLVTCPKSIRKVWEQQVHLHAPDFGMPSVHLLNTTTAGLAAYERWIATVKGPRWLIVGIEAMSSSPKAIDIAKRFVLSTTRAAMVVDEASKIKTHNAKRTETCCELARMCEYRMIMTGTPIAKGPLDLYAQFEFLDPNIIGLGDYYSYRNQYAVMGGYDNKEVIGYQNLDELFEILKPFVYQVRKADVLDIPPKVYTKRVVELTDAQRKLYRQMKSTRTLSTAKGSITVQNVLERMLRLQEITGGFVSLEKTDDPTVRETYRVPIEGKNPKLDELMSLLEDTDETAVIWAVWKDEIMLIVDALVQVYGRDAVVEMHGNVDETQRAINVARIQSGDARFMVGNAATGGMGITVTAATLEIYFSNSHNFIDREQSEDRAHRDGQKRSVTIVDIVTEDTVDEAVLLALQSKKNVSEYVRDNLNNESALFGEA